MFCFYIHIPVVCSLFVLPKHFRCIQAFLSRPGPPNFHILTKVACSTLLCHTTRTATSALSFYTFSFNHDIMISWVSAHVWRLLHWPHEHSTWALTHEWALARDTVVHVVKNEWYLTCFPLLFNLKYFGMCSFIVRSCVCRYVFFHLEEGYG